jgi:hypothetical protein
MAMSRAWTRVQQIGPSGCGRGGAELVAHGLASVIQAASGQRLPWLHHRTRGRGGVVTRGTTIAGEGSGLWIINVAEI